MNDKNKVYNMIDEFHVMFMYRKIQAEAATTDLKTLNQLLRKFRKVVAEQREEYYQEIGEKKAQKLRAKRLQQLLEKMERDRVSLKELCYLDSDLT
ncbi:DNA-binding protein [Pectobacterium odoriferum]|nr:DNA-binding protein [Pectobacterium odoriferum]